MPTPIVLVPGLLCTLEVFSGQMAALRSQGPVTVASTLQGQTIAEIAAHVLEDAPQRFALVGFSMGGYIALEIMRQAPERVTRLALISTSARADTPQQTRLRRELLAAARGRDPKNWADEVLTQFAQSRPEDPALHAFKVRMAEAVGVEGFERQMRAIMTRIDSRPSLAAIRVPTVVMVGDIDPFTPPGVGRELAAGIAGARLVVIPHCGHGAPMEQPQRVSAELVAWLTAAA